MLEAFSPAAHIDNTNEFDNCVRALIDGPSPETVAILVIRLPPYGMACEDCAESLRHPQPAERIQRLARVLMDLAYGADCEFASGLGQAILRLWPSRIETIAFRSEWEKSMVLLTVIRSTARALMLSGDFRESIYTVDKWLCASRFRSFGAHYASAKLGKAEALTNQLRIDEAIATIQELTREELSAAAETTVVWGYIQPYLVEPLKSERLFSLGERLRELVEGPLEENKKTVAAWTASWNNRQFREELRNWANVKLDRLRDMLNQLGHISVNPDLSEQTRLDHLTRGLYEFGVEARELLLGGATAKHFDLNSANERCNYAAMVANLIAPTIDETERALTEAAHAQAWSELHGCDRVLQDSLQAQRSLYARKNDKPNARSVNLLLLRELRLLRARTANLQVRAGIARVFRRLIFAICDLASEFSAPDEALSATEFRRGLSIAESRRSHDQVGPDPLVKSLGPDLLGSNTHYLGLTAFDEDERVAATLYCANGAIVFAWIPLTPAQLRNPSLRLRPEEWEAKAPLFGTRKTDPRPKLACLLSLVLGAMAEGGISDGDHICVAADDPIHAIPFHYLPLNGKPAICSLSFSRVASLLDARQTYESSNSRPERAVAAFVPAMPEGEVEEKGTAFDEICVELTGADLAVTVMRKEEVSQASLLGALACSPLTYIHAHGRFRADVDPLDFAGLLVSENGQLPLRGFENALFLTPRSILDAAPFAAGGVVALSACVSGLGRRGGGGDTIGLEFALRAQGASSVIASHWDVNWQSSSKFFQRFFHLWLVQLRSRASAWRHAILEQGSMNDASSQDLGLLSACAFSLFGDWR